MERELSPTSIIHKNWFPYPKLITCMTQLLFHYVAGEHIHISKHHVGTLWIGTQLLSLALSFSQVWPDSIGSTWLLRNELGEVTPLTSKVSERKKKHESGIWLAWGDSVCVWDWCGGWNWGGVGQSSGKRPQFFISSSNKTPKPLWPLSVLGSKYIIRLKLNVEKVAGGSDDYYRKSRQSNEKVAPDNIKTN